MLLLVVSLLLPCTAVALSGEAYLKRFLAYREWSRNFPAQPSQELIDFMNEPAPLSQKLRGRWLYELARTKQWPQYLSHYQPSLDNNLVCYRLHALYNTGRAAEAVQAATPLWLTGDSLAPACNTFFDILLKNNKLGANLITQRFMMALSQYNMPLALYLLKQYRLPRTQDMQALSSIAKNPANISKLITNDLKDDLYLFGLNKMVTINMQKAISLWEQVKKNHLLSESQQQAFLAHMVLYKAMRNHEDTLAWFNKVKPAYYNDTFVDWGIRFALKRNDWQQVIRLIQVSKDKDLLCWQYWLARALEEKGDVGKAKAIYNTLAANRHYYGFLASMRLHKMPSFENEKPSVSMEILKPYQPILDEIHTLYASKKIGEASHLLSDFISELPKDEASALLYWVDTKLQWYGKSVYLSSTEQLNNQLVLRFPLAYQETVALYAKQYAVSPEFVYAIIRQESGFRDDVISSAGARGLMQIMPNTAAIVSKISKIPYTRQNELFISQKNINIGIAYLQQLGKRFDNHPVLIAAAYNAGPKQVVYWLRTHPPKEIDLWIETLPWQETRNYLKNVMAFYIVYQYRLHQKPDLKNFLKPF